MLYQSPKLFLSLALIAAHTLVACTSKNDDQVDTYSSTYTSVAVEQCRQLKAHAIRQSPLLRLGQVVYRCPAPGQYVLFLVDDGTRSWFVLEHNGKLYTLESEIVYGKTAGHFPNVGTNDNIEWVLNEKKLPVGFVFNVSYQSEHLLNKRFQKEQRYMAYSFANGIPELITQQEDKNKCRRLLVEALVRR